LRHRRKLISILCLALLCAPAWASPSGQTSTTPSKTSSKKRTHKTTKSRARGQKAIDSQRVREIQTALIRENYLSGQPTGVWDQRSKDAMAKYQSDNGWQTKVVPDSRALIKLGLGPDQANLINPDTAATAVVPGGGVTRALPQTPER
jgi:peptidoglycan hydrolase-like protein with peptidoglycan-binding domain